MFTEEKLCRIYTKEYLAELYSELKGKYTDMLNEKIRLGVELAEVEKARDAELDMYADATKVYEAIKERMSIDEYLALNRMFDTDLGTQKTSVYKLNDESGWITTGKF